jgi:PAS domain S-box-containing protein
VTVTDEVLGVLDAFPEPVLLVTSAGQIAGGNRALAEQLAANRAELVGRALTEMLADSPERVREYLATCERSGQMVPGSLTLRATDGAPVACRANGTAYRPRTGAARLVLVRLTPHQDSVTSFIALNEKISELSAEVARRRQAEASLSRERETLQVTLESIGDGVFVTDAQGRITFVNRMAEQLTGCSLTSVVGRPLADVFQIVDEETGEPAADPVQQVLATGRIAGLTGRVVLIRQDGTRIPVDDSAAPIRLAGEAPAGVVLIFRDITARRQAEREQQEADRRKDEFLAILAHELRNPLAPIRNAMQIMRMAEGDRAIVSAARVIVERQIKHLARLIDDLMDISRITQGKIELRQEYAALSAIIQMAVEIARPQLEGRQHPLQIELPSEGLYLNADSGRLAQALGNLLENASTYSTPEAPIRIEATATDEEIVLQVIDQGVGIPPDMLERIFDLFAQVDRSGNGIQDGLGVGLTLVKRIVQLHGGSVRAESDGPDRGSRFILRLPRARPTESVSRVEPAARVSTPARRLRILVADDNRDAVQTLALMLTLGGHEVRAAHDGAEAIAIGDGFQPHVVFLDIGMPVLDGYATARRIQKRPWGKTAHLVALTGWGQDADRRKAIAAGFRDHLVKPAALDAISDIIERVVIE